MAILKTYDLKGNKLSFANWISNLSPTETPFTSMIGKESVDQTRYSWQVDRLSAPMNTGFEEGSDVVFGTRPITRPIENFTQILRKVVKITDTANKIGLYGRASEKAYQMEKAGKEIRRDLEKMVLQNEKGVYGSAGHLRTFSGFAALVAPANVKDLDTGAIVHKQHKAANANAKAFGEKEIFDMTYNLYLAGSKANKVMVHPKHMFIFSGFIGGADSKSKRMFDNVDPKFNAFVKSFRDPLGQVFEIIPNRHMQENKVFFFNESDWTQMILRAPETRELARVGSSEKHMIEMEVGLRHRNPYASGVLELIAHDAAAGVVTYDVSLTHPEITIGGTGSKLQIQAYKDGVIDNGSTDAVVVTFSPDTGAEVTGGNNFSLAAGKADKTITSTAAGTYEITVRGPNNVVATVTLVVNSADLRKAPVVEAEAEEVKAAPKARKAKAE